MSQNKNLLKPRLDLGYGNPGFLQDLWQDARPIGVHKNLSYDMPYKASKDNYSELEQQIRLIHKNYKNCFIDETSHIVVTVGAVQALQAAMYAYKSTLRKFIYIPNPYWGRFKVFAKALGYEVASTTHQSAKDAAAAFVHEDEVALLTTPNNPDGVLYDNMPATIRDACYNWPQYYNEGEKVALVNDPIIIFSLSKLSGHSSTRIGWAIVKDADVAAKMREYVELFSSGVSIQSQESAAHILRRLNTKNGRLLLKLAQATLSDRHKAIQRIVKEKSLPVKILSERGMFLYVQCRPQFIYDLKITCFAGSECGDTQKGRYRLNLGCTDEAYRELIARLEALADLYSDK